MVNICCIWLRLYNYGIYAAEVETVYRIFIVKEDVTELTLCNGVDTA